MGGENEGTGCENRGEQFHDFGEVEYSDRVCVFVVREFIALTTLVQLKRDNGPGLTL
jgi:hypothetical protein